MNILKQLPKYAVMGIILAGLVLAVSKFFGTSTQTERTERVDVRVPQLSALATQGENAFNANCALCHGKNAAGTDKGPPLVHNLYNPGHHGDQAFVIAAKRGVRAHHWRFGNMKPVPQVTDTQLTAIIKYVRELQVANGILTKPHNM